MKVVFFGEDAFSARVLASLIKAGIKVGAVITPLYDNFIFKRLELLANNNSIPFLREKDINGEAVVELVKSLHPDLIVIAHFEKLLKKDLLLIPSKGCINLHPSLLPKYRGMAPQHWPIINGDHETGVSVHYVEEGIDTGNIIVQKKIKIEPDVYVNQLQMQMLPLYDSVVVEAINLVGEGYKGMKQDLSQGSIFGKFKSSNAGITDSTTKTEACNLIRAISKPYMGARYQQYKIWKAHIPEAQDELSARYPATGFYKTSDDKAVLRLADGVLAIDDYELSESPKT